MSSNLQSTVIRLFGTQGRHAKAGAALAMSIRQMGLSPPNPQRSAARGGPRPYRGPDRRGVIGLTRIAATHRNVAASLATVATLPWIGVGVVSVATFISVQAWSAGAADAAFVALIVVTLLLLLRWRLLGEALASFFAGATALVGLLVVPTATHLGGQISTYGESLEAVCLATALVCCVKGLRSEEIRSDLRPVVIVRSVVLTTFMLSVPLGFSPAREVVTGHLGSFEPIKLVGFSAAVVVAALLVREGLKRRRMLMISMGTLLLSAGAAYLTSSDTASSTNTAWRSLPMFFLLSGAGVMLAVVTESTKSVMTAVVLLDVRGRRRWEAAEAQLADVEHGYQGQRHDMTSLLSAIDGTLFVLSKQRERFLEEEVDRLLEASREQIHWLRTVLVEREEAACAYDLSKVIDGIVSVRAVDSQLLRCEVESGLEVRGRPDRIAIVINNLLTNACNHSPEATVTVRSARYCTPAGEFIDIVISDDGPGLPDADLAHATERGWRGGDGSRSGSGLGLYQCRVLAEDEGGEIILSPTDPLAAPGRRGLTVRVKIPVKGQGTL